MSILIISNKLKKELKILKKLNEYFVSGQSNEYFSEITQRSYA